MRSNSNSVLESGEHMVLSLVGYAVGVGSLVGIASNFVVKEEFNPIGLLIYASMLVLSIIALVESRKIKARMDRLPIYKDVIPRGRTSVQEIAVVMELPAELVAVDLRKLIAKGLIKSTGFDASTMEVVSTAVEDEIPSSVADFEYVICTHCGSKIRKRIDETVQCHFCDTMLS